MKVKTMKTSTDFVLNLPVKKRKRAPYPSFLFSTLVRILSIFELRKAGFTCEKTDLKKIGKGPILILMNHSSFIDLKIASKLFYPRKYNIIATSDAMLGKEWLMRRLGCIPTNKFVPDVPLVLECAKIIKKKKRSVLLYPEAGYSLDGTATTLPKSLAPFIKAMGVTVVTVITDGAYLYDPLYNELKKRKVKISAKVKRLMTPEEIECKSTEEIQALVEKEFSFDNFKTQYENGIAIKENTRADGLHRVLYKCPNCLSEGKTVGKGETLTCTACGKVYRMEENGRMKAKDGLTEYAHIPDWFKWQREQVKEQILKGEYGIGIDVDLGVLCGYKSFYEVGGGKLTHNLNGFEVVSADGKIKYSQSPLWSYSINADFYWYEGSDVVSVGTKDILYYCFPKDGAPVAKIRLAAEEMFKLYKSGVLKKLNDKKDSTH